MDRLLGHTRLDNYPQVSFCFMHTSWPERSLLGKSHMFAYRLVCRIKCHSPWPFMAKNDLGSIRDLVLIILVNKFYAFSKILLLILLNLLYVIFMRRTTLKVAHDLALFQAKPEESKFATCPSTHWGKCWTSSIPTLPTLTTKARIFWPS